MDAPIDLRKLVVAELNRRVGDIRAVAQATDLSYDTVLRIKNEEGDPGYSKVQALAEYLFPDGIAVRLASTSTERAAEPAKAVA